MSLMRKITRKANRTHNIGIVLLYHYIIILYTFLPTDQGSLQLQSIRS
jgi:hypothetical protein